MTLTETGPGPGNVTTGDLLVVEDITVQFGGVVANDNVSLSCRRGSITALIGPNGAGKSTFFDVVTGARRPNRGRVFFDGVDVTDTPPYVRARLGIGRTFQNLAVARSMSVLDNVVLVTLRMRRSGLLAALARTPAARRGDDELRAVAERALHLVGLGHAASLPAGRLPYGDLRRLEIARLLALSPQFLMLDEPAAGMDAPETEALAQALLAIRDRWDVTLLVVEHDIGLVRTVADDVHVLEFGKLLTSGPAHDVLSDPRVIKAYLGARHA